MAFFKEPEAREMMTKWSQDGVLESNYQKISQKGIDGHLVRLLTHDKAPACRDFALAMMKYLPEIDEEVVDNIYCHQITDGDEQAQFWTFGPYIYEALRKSREGLGKKADDREEFWRVLLWLRSRKMVKGETGANAIYPGVGEGRDYFADLYLPRDGQHPMHQLVEKVGKHIASYMEKVQVTEEMVNDRSKLRTVRV